MKKLPLVVSTGLYAVFMSLVIVGLENLQNNKSAEAAEIQEKGSAKAEKLAHESDASSLDMDCAGSGNPGDIESIRGQRQLFNRAIADKDDSVIESVLHEDVILVTGTDSDLFEGRDAQVTIWQDDFGREDRAIYERTPACIRVSGMAPVALEFGTWRGVKVNDASAFAAGSYSAKWRKIDGHWLLEGELFSSEACGGSFCPEKTPDEGE